MRLHIFEESTILLILQGREPHCNKAKSYDYAGLVEMVDGSNSGASF